MRSTGTIVALSTPPGRSGIGVIRISGDDALTLTRSLLGKLDFDPEPHRVTLQTLLDPESGEELDRGLVTYFKAPRSYTGEDVVELSCHGSPPLLLRVLDSLLHLGARTAEPGEFTLRALANGALNLPQAEAVRDLIEARTYTAVRHAARQLGGELSERLRPVKAALLDIIVPLESSLEFVEDDLPADVTLGIARKLSTLRQLLEDLAATFQRGRLLKDGIRVALVGRPNVGKSTVFNNLLKQDRAIVTDIPGTTRDTLSELINIQDVPVLIYDTAGIRASEDKIEQFGIERTRKAVVDSDLIVIVLDGSQHLTSEDKSIFAEAAQSRFIVALNKTDLGLINYEEVLTLSNQARTVPISAKNGEGIDLLCQAIIEPFAKFDTHDMNFVITNARHFDLLRRTGDSLRQSEELLVAQVSEEVVLVGLYGALRSLDEITGETTPEDILSQIFSTFCIGK